MAAFRLSVALVGSLFGIMTGAAACGSDAASSDVEVVDPPGRQEAGPPPADAGPSIDAEPPPDSAPFTPRYVDINHVLATGQSLSVGAVGAPALTDAQPYGNLMFNTGVMAGATSLTSFVPLVEGDVIPGGNTAVETMSSAFANAISKDAVAALAGAPAAEQKHDLLVSVHGIGGASYAQIKKNGTLAAYQTGMAQLAAGDSLAKAAGKTFVVRAVTNVHGETDHQLANTHYKEDLLEFQSDYEKDVQAKTGQPEPVPMFQTQMSSWTKLAGGLKTSTIPGQQLAAHVAAPGKVILVGPKYHLPYAPDGVHLTNAGYRHMGEDYAKAYRRVVLEGKPWEPVRPRSVTRAGKVITVTFHVPSPPLVLDTTRVTDPGKNGFEFSQTGAVVAIDSVAVTAPDQVTITLASEPAGTNQRIRYAFTGNSGALGGPTTGPRGNLRDSDGAVSRHGNDLFNWCIHFDEAVP